MLYSANTDPDLRDWLRWVSERSEAPSFVRAVADAALIADLLDYALLRPVLLELRRNTTACRSCLTEAWSEGRGRIDA